MSIFVSKKDNETKIKVVKEDKRASTFMVEFLNGDKKGSSTVYSSSTMKRWWKKINEEESVRDLAEPLCTVKEVATEKSQKIDTISIKKQLEDCLGVSLVELPSTKGLYAPSIKPKPYYIGITKSHLSLYIKSKPALKIKYTESYIAKVLDALS